MQDVVQCGGDKKVLLFEAQFLSLLDVIARIKNLRNISLCNLGLNGADVIALVELLKVEFGAGLRDPQSHVRHITVLIARNPCRFRLDWIHSDDLTSEVARPTHAGSRPITLLTGTLIYKNLGFFETAPKRAWGQCWRGI